MKTKHFALILVAFLTAITGIRLVWIAVMAPPSHPYAIQGALDLTKWDLSSNRAIPLNGEWDFYPYALYMQDPGKLARPDLLRVPGNWQPLKQLYGQGLRIVIKWAGASDSYLFFRKAL
ncbi:hypothetical protein [Paenibacillus cymbidii]|uniref:hypothetical protein n=1 Tax=Paenibacillus cymbidii TaxID=1639034 RepID=UPI00108057E0|nr:hypothetical protein [Paenibacillus cymbidii]